MGMDDSFPTRDRGDDRTTMTAPTPSTRHLDRGEGRLAYDDTGEGPLVVCVPGMGDLRSSYRHLRPRLLAAGLRVVTVDLRGHGDSDTTFAAYDDLALGGDLVALLRHLGVPAVVVGNSMGAGGAVLAAADAPDLVAGLVLVGPFVRDVPVGRAALVAFRLALRRPWGPSAWSAWYARSHPWSPPPDLDEHRAAISGWLRRPGAWQAFVATSRTSHAPAEARLADVSAPALVVMGTADHDFPDPEAEARLVADRLVAELVLVPDVGHYPQAEAPAAVADAVVPFVRTHLGRG
jgi:pimeloyl-ACP methyl ester carboxylesterase